MTSDITKAARTNGVGLVARLRIAAILLMQLKPHDFRAARQFMVMMYPDVGWLRRLGMFTAWICEQLFSSIPVALQNSQFERPVSRTPIWLADGNPFANHPWASQPDAKLPESAEVVVIGAGFTGAGCAYHWSKQNAGRMVVLEMDDAASGASGRNQGVVVMGRYFASVRDTVQPYLARVRADLTPEQRERMSQQFAVAYVHSAYRNGDLVEQTVRNERYECEYARTGWIQARDEEHQHKLGRLRAVEPSITVPAAASVITDLRTPHQSSGPVHACPRPTSECTRPERA